MITHTIVDTSTETTSADTGGIVTEDEIKAINVKDAISLIVNLIYLLEHLKWLLSKPFSRGIICLNGPLCIIAITCEETDIVISGTGYL